MPTPPSQIIVPVDVDDESVVPVAVTLTKLGLPVVCTFWVIVAVSPPPAATLKLQPLELVIVEDTKLLLPLVETSELVVSPLSVAPTN